MFFFITHRYLRHQPRKKNSAAASRKNTPTKSPTARNVSGKHSPGQPPHSAPHKKSVPERKITNAPRSLPLRHFLLCRKVPNGSLGEGRGSVRCPTETTSTTKSPRRVRVSSLVHHQRVRFHRRGRVVQRVRVLRRLALQLTLVGQRARPAVAEEPKRETG